MKVIKIAFGAIVFVIGLIAVVIMLKQPVHQKNSPQRVDTRAMDRELAREQYRQWARQPHLRAAKI